MPPRRSNSNPPAKGSRTSGRLTVTDLVESDPDAPSKSLKRKASPERSSNDYSPYPASDHVPAKQNRASASPALSALLNGPSPPLRPTQGSPIANPPPALTPPTTNATINAPPSSSALSPPQPKAITEITKASSSSTGKRAAPSATSAPASPKPAPRSTVPVAKSGGLLAGAFGDVALGEDDPDPLVPTVVLQISLNGETNKYIDVSKMAEEKYGWAALNPRLARAKLRGPDASGDEAMMDASESESAMEEKLGGGMSDAGLSGTGEKDKPKKRRRRVDEYYDANDPFIDDSEMLWEEQAAASKDGFFVYSGPLVPEGERPQIERTNGGPPKRGRGRGGRGAGTGRGAGNAGKSTAPRKPRVTKALKEKMEKEKEEREKTAMKMAAATQPSPQVPRSIPA
ncbi:hypothetical protein H072_569 [Dactylellina haptotyla CBS 200.50]|uniref:Hpc2-related domain-containing protein n=1 Tax=Dactylellina haptotyla (strain CBS 200.50) TaxID=1284197 RepID=S8AR11_DACHA|nr:hypothetical protein H072_569 [Dactylellina haptotyla CBS 200.50]